MKPEEICVLIPTRNRLDGLARVIRSLKDTAPTMVYVVIGDPDDPLARDFCDKNFIHYVQTDEPKKGCSYAWNAGLKAYPDYAAYILGADDLVFMPGWYGATMAGLEKLGGSGMVGFNDGRKNGNQFTATHYMMTRDFIIEYNGGVMACPHYTAEYVDAEANHRAKSFGKFIWMESAHVAHYWKGPWGDETYMLANDRKAENRTIYQNRMANGFPDDYPPILTAKAQPEQTPKKGRRSHARRQ